jgi:hypothetical protein
MDINFNIFISHDSKDEAIAIELKSFLENIFLNGNVYVSGRDLKGGQTWIEDIKLRLKTSQVVISIISKESIHNNWIYFETGAGFTDDKSIPLITDGLKFADLVPPLSLLQSRALSKPGIELLVNDIAGKVNLRTPKVLTGIEQLLEESDKFFALRDKEKSDVSGEKKDNIRRPKQATVATDKPSTDPIILDRYKKTRERACELTRRSILTFKGKLDLPTEGELRELDVGKLMDIALGYNIPYPTAAFTDILIAGLSIPAQEAKEWEKVNIRKTLDVVNAELDRFEKTLHSLPDTIVP